MTGLEGHTLGLTYYKEGYELPTEETLPRILSRAGYQTGVVGKMHVYPERCHYGFDSMLLCEEGRRLGQATGEHRGYDDYELWLAEQGYAGQAFAHGMANNEFNMTPWHLTDHLHPTEWIGTEACKAIKRRDWTRPMFLWASFTAPHPPLTPLARELALYDLDVMPKPSMGDWVEDGPVYCARNAGPYGGWMQTEKQVDRAHRGFCAMTTQVDRLINRILGTLREQGMLDHTWILFTSDHGDNMGDHGLWGKSNFFRGSTGIPLIVAPPISWAKDAAEQFDWFPGRTNGTPVGLQDLLPTLVSIAGQEVPDDIDGRSLLPLVEQPDASVRTSILGEFGVAGRRSFMLADARWKYMWFEEDGRELLFDTVSDLGECRNVADAEQEITLAWRRSLLDLLRRRTNDPACGGEGLRASAPGTRLRPEELAHMAADLNPRGTH